MLMAADPLFKSIVGVEYAKRLYEIAVQNCRTYRSAKQWCQSLQPILGDVLDYAPPPDLPCSSCVRDLTWFVA
jgi:hypothetical protein